MEIKKIEAIAEGQLYEVLYNEENGNPNEMHVFASCEVHALAKAQQIYQLNQEIKALQTIAGIKRGKR